MAITVVPPVAQNVNHIVQILLFISDCRRELVCKRQVECLQDQAQLALAHFVSQAHPHNPARFGKMLLTLPCLKNVHPDVIEKSFFKRTIGNATINHVIHAIR